MNISFEASDIEKDSADELAAVFKNCDAVIGCSGTEGSSDIQLKLTQAAIATGIKRYIPWQFGVDYDILERESIQDLFDEQLDVCAALREQNDIGWVIVSTGSFMSLLFEDFFGVVSRDRKTARALGIWQNTVTVTDVEDVGKVTAEVGWDGDGIRKEVVFIAGDTISYEDLTEAAEEVQSSPIERIEWTVQYLKEELVRDPENSIKKYRVVFAEAKMSLVHYRRR